MTKRDFFILVIKLFGLLSIVTSLFTGLIGNITFALADIDAFSVMWIVVSIVIVIGLFVLLIYKADNIVSLLKLDKGFDEDRIELGNLSSADIIKIGSFIIGGLLILESVPAFLSHTYFAFKWSLVGLEYEKAEKLYWFASGLNIIVGYLLITQYDFVARLLHTSKREKIKNDMPTTE